MKLLKEIALNKEVQSIIPSHEFEHDAKILMDTYKSRFRIYKAITSTLVGMMIGTFILLSLLSIYDYFAYLFVASVIFLLAINVHSPFATSKIDLALIILELGNEEKVLFEAFDIKGANYKERLEFIKSETLKDKGLVLRMFETVKPDS